VALFDFSCSLLATFGEKNLTKENGREVVMKIATRVFVFALILSAVGVAQTSAFAGPGIPIPPDSVVV
jgi:hypothetical protein